MNLGKNQLEFHGNIYNHVITESDSKQSLIIKMVSRLFHSNEHENF